ncbi:MAG: AI-2E family transporter [Anditalea sp.]
MQERKRLLLNFTLLVLGTYFLFMGLTKAQGFLKPLVTALIFSLLMIPVANKFESWNFSRILSSVCNTLILFIISLGFFMLISFQIKGFVEDWDKIKETMEPNIESFENFVLTHTPLEKEQLEEYKKENNVSTLFGGGSGGEKAFQAVNQVLGFLADYLLTFIYIFFLLNYRRRFKEFVLRLFPQNKRGEVAKVVNKTAGVAQHYLFGKFLLIIFLAVLYSIGLGISGVSNFIFVSLLAALLSLIPYFGNIIGFFIALAFGMISGGDSGTFIGVIIVFSLVQFIESYILEPYIVGDQVDIHPFFIIVVVIIGNMVWGVMGMILAVPLVGIINVVFRNVESLKVFGFLLSNNEEN